MRSLLVAVGLLAFGGGSALVGQILHAISNRPSFEAATVKPFVRPTSQTPGRGSPPVKVNPGNAPPPSGDHIRAILPISILVGLAYNLPPGSGDVIIGGPEWIQQDIEQFEIQAKIEASEWASMQTMNRAQQQERVALMYQSLLADRFGLKVHFETRELPVYTLVVAKGGAKLTPAKNVDPHQLSTLSSGQESRMTAAGVTLEEFVYSPLVTGSAGGRRVVDQTGLKGAFDFTLQWTPQQAIDADAPSFFTAIREQLGLMLVPSKAPVEVIVIDHIEKPSAN